MYIVIVCIFSAAWLILLRLAAVGVIRRKIYTEDGAVVCTYNSEDSIEFNIRSAIFRSGGGGISVYDGNASDEARTILSLLERDYGNINIVLE